MDLFGDQSVQVVTATLQAVLALLALPLVMLLSVRLRGPAAVRPALATLPCTGRLLCLERDAEPSRDGPLPCLLTRAPPGDPPSELASTGWWALRRSGRSLSRSSATSRSRVGL